LGRSSGIHIIDMAGRAGQRRMGAGQRVTRVFQVIKFRGDEVIHAVAGLARRGEVEGDVVDDRRQEILLVARITSCRQPYELARSRIFMALIAFNHGVSAHQREPVLVALNSRDIYLPAFHGVAALAIGSKLAAVNVCVALRTLRTHLLEHQVGVALRARNLSMHPAQRIASRIVVKLGVGSDGLPAHAGVAILTRCGDRAMGVGYLRLGEGRLGVEAVSRHVHLQTAQRGTQPDRYRKYPAKPIQRVSPTSPKGRKTGKVRAATKWQHRELTPESKLLERELPSREIDAVSRFRLRS
jgi:hypothetical protein